MHAVFCYSRHRSKREVQVSFSGGVNLDCAHPHFRLLAHKPFGVGGEANQVPLACHLKQTRLVWLTVDTFLEKRLYNCCLLPSPHQNPGWAAQRRRAPERGSRRPASSVVCSLRRSRKRMSERPRRESTFIRSALQSLLFLLFIV